jgi:hypothetical protein
MPGAEVAGVERALGPSGEALRWAGAQIELSVSKPAASTGMSEGMLHAALGDAARTWNQHLEACGAPSFRVAADSAARASVARDGVSRVVVRSKWCPAGARDFEDCYDASRAAITHVYPEGAPAHGALLVAEADIEINAEHFRWSELGGDGGRPLTATLTHELGHVLGLDHPCRPPHEAGPGSVSCASSAAKGWLMYPDPAEPGRAVVTGPLPAEVAAVCAAYSRPTGGALSGPIFGSLSGALVLTLLGVLFRGQRERKTRSRVPT